MPEPLKMTKARHQQRMPSKNCIVHLHDDRLVKRIKALSWCSKGSINAHFDHSEIVILTILGGGSQFVQLVCPIPV